MKRSRDYAFEAARRILWGDREDLLPHMLEHQCAVTAVIAELCETARWTFDSYLLASLFDSEELLVEVSG